MADGQVLPALFFVCFLLILTLQGGHLLTGSDRQTLSPHFCKPFCAKHLSFKWIDDKANTSLWPCDVYASLLFNYNTACFRETGKTDKNPFLRKGGDDAPSCQSSSQTPTLRQQPLCTTSLILQRQGR